VSTARNGGRLAIVGPAKYIHISVILHL
jgi:hypothetical protein